MPRSLLVCPLAPAITRPVSGGEYGGGRSVTMTEDRDPTAAAPAPDDGSPDFAMTGDRASRLDHPAHKPNLAEEVVEFGDTVRAILSL